MTDIKKVCSRCVMDTTDTHIFFNKDGICSHCLAFQPQFLVDNSAAKQNLEMIKSEVGNSKSKYDCIIGVSGGVDSSYVVYLAHQLGLKAMLVHFDNGWNSPIAVKNVKKLIEKTGFDLQTLVVNWEEFKDLQRSFFRAGVIDIELLTDHAIFATINKVATDNKIKYALSGANYATEHGMPDSWNWHKWDRKNILNIHRQFGEQKLASFPLLNPFLGLVKRKVGTGPITIEILNKIDYDSTEAIRTLESFCGWEYYGGKHYESVFTKFYQAYVLPKKFNVDKRKVHFSAKIRNGETSRELALEELKVPLYEESELRKDREYVIEKIEFSEAEFEEILNQPPVPHERYGTDLESYRLLSRLLR